MEWNLAIDIDDKIVKLNLKNNAMCTIIPLDFKTMASSNAHVHRRNDDGIFSLFFAIQLAKNLPYFVVVPFNNTTKSRENIPTGTQFLQANHEESKKKLSTAASSARIM